MIALFVFFFFLESQARHDVFFCPLNVVRAKASFCSSPCPDLDPLAATRITLVACLLGELNAGGSTVVNFGGR